jgi:hypothetical protein
VAALVIQLMHAEDMHIDLLALFAPVLVFGLCAVAVTSALAVLFESLPVLRGGIGNVIYFFVWIFLLTASASTLDKSSASQPVTPYTDFTGIATVMGQMMAVLRHLDPSYDNGASFSVGGLMPTTKTFLWTGLAWNADLVLSRFALLGIAVALSLLAALFFDRFDPARNALRSAKKPKRSPQSPQAQGDGLGASDLPQARGPVPHLTPLARAASRSRWLSLVLVELRLMLRGHAWWWYAAEAGLFIACLASPIDAARQGLIIAAWVLPTLVWSQMGTREARFATGSLIFSAPHAVPRQMLAVYAAGALVAALTGGGLGLHLLFLRDAPGLAAWAAAVLFIPAAALALGVVSESRKPFEALYTAGWYLGPGHHIRGLDFMGTTDASSTPAAYLAAALLLVLLAYGWRRVRLAHA